MSYRDEDDNDTPAPTLSAIIENEADRERMIKWKLEYLPCDYFQWLPYIYYSYCGKPWGRRDGRVLRWGYMALRLHGRFSSW